MAVESNVIQENDKPHHKQRDVNKLKDRFCVIHVPSCLSLEALMFVEVKVRKNSARE